MRYPRVIIVFFSLIMFATCTKNIYLENSDTAINEIPVDELPFKIETDYATPHKCEDPETGITYKIGAEWISSDPSMCYKMTCETRYFPLVKKIECSEFFKTANPRTECNVKKMSKFPNCCEHCKRRS